MKICLSFMAILFLLPSLGFSQEIVSIYPNNAQADHSIKVKVLGNNTQFNQVTTAVILYNSTNGDEAFSFETDIISNTELIADFWIADDFYQGSYSIMVWNLLGHQLILPDCFFVHSSNVLPQIALQPNLANAGQTLNVTITGTGTHFNSGSGTYVDFDYGHFGTDVINSLDIVSNTCMIANISIPSNTYTGDYQVSIYNGTDGNMSKLFHVNGLTPPALQTITPATANAGQTLNVTISGINTHFNSASSTSLHFGFEQGSPTVVNSLNVVSNTSLFANITIPEDTYTGDYDVDVSNGIDGNISILQGFHVTGQPIPGITAINPSTANAGQTLNVTITGINTQFNSGSSTNVSFNFHQASSTTVVNSIDVISNESLMANVTIPGDLYTGYYDVYVDGDLYWGNNSWSYYNFYLNSAFFIQGQPSPSLNSINPLVANAGQTVDFTITGNNTHFSEAAGTYVGFSSYECGDFILINSIIAQNNEEMQINATIPYYMNPGTYDVYVFNNIDKLMMYPACLQINSTHVDEFDNMFFEVYPNPTDDFIKIEMKNIESFAKIDIYNMQGILLISRELSQNLINMISLSTLPSGIYFYKITAEEKTQTGKILKH